jgi:hypothetical protein
MGKRQYQWGPISTERFDRHLLVERSEDVRDSNWVDQSFKDGWTNLKNFSPLCVRRYAPTHRT